MADTLNPTGAGLTAAVHLDLTREIRDSEQRKPWQSGIYSKTLIKKKDFRIVLISMDRAARMDEHHTDGTVSIQGLTGAILVVVGDRKIELRAGHLLTLEPSIKHNVEALEGSAFLVTFSWPSSEELREMKHRGYGS